MIPAIGFTQTTWIRSYGGSSVDQGSAAKPTPDGGYIITGQTKSFSTGDYDIYVAKLYAAGGIQWQQTYGGSMEEWPWSVITTTDGGYLVHGYSYSFGAGDADWWILKLGSAGDIQWQRAFGGSGFDHAREVKQTTDGGYIVAGSTTSFGSGDQDAWIMKLSSSGNIQWQKAYGNTVGDVAYSIAETPDGGYITAGFNGITASTRNAWVAKLDSSGSIQWERQYGSVANQYAQQIQPTSDGGYIVGLEDINTSTGHTEFVALKLDSNGNIAWQKRYSGGVDDQLWSVQQTTDTGYVFSGNTFSFGAGSMDIWIVKTDATGNVEWQKSYGTPDFEESILITQAPDGGYVLAGNSGEEIVVLKLDGAGEIGPGCSWSSDTFGTTTVATLFAVGVSSIVVTTNATVTATTVTPIPVTADTQELCGPPCLFCDDFDDGILAADWDYVKPAWSESNGSLIATPARKAQALATPAFAGCSGNCAFEAGLNSAGGQGNVVWMQAWYTDKGNVVELIMKEPNDKFVLRQKSGGKVVAKTKASKVLDPNVTYNARITFDGTTFTLIVDGQTLATLPAGGPASGTVGFEAKNTTATFDHVRVD